MNREKIISRVQTLAIILGSLTVGYYVIGDFRVSRIPNTEGTVMTVDGTIAGAHDRLMCSALIHDKFQKAGDTVIVRIQSSGGRVDASQFLYDELMYCKAKYNKRLIVYIPVMALSGGMFIASAGDEVIAAPHAMIGSIGVFGTIASAPEILSFLGIRIKCYAYGSRRINEKISKIPAFADQITDEMREELQEYVDRTEAKFYSVVSSKEGVNAKALPKLQGEFFRADSARAADLNFTDQLMTHDEFLSYAYSKGYIKDKSLAYTNLNTVK
jgi:ClpP class serine protease